MNLGFVWYVFTLPHTHRHRAMLYTVLVLVKSRVSLPANTYLIMHPAGTFVPRAVRGDVASRVLVLQGWPRERESLFSEAVGYYCAKTLTLFTLGHHFKQS